MLLVKLLVNSRLLVVNFWRVKSYTQIFDWGMGSGGWHPNPHVVQGSAVYMVYRKPTLNVKHM